MHRSLRHILMALAVAAVAFVASTATAMADDGTTPAPTSQLSDTSHQVADIQQQIAKLQAKGRTVRTGALTASAASSCGFQNPSQVFLPWGDLASYSLAPQGDLASTSSWTLKHATVNSGDNPLTAGGNSLLLNQGDSEAISPAMCVDLTNPTIRLFVKDTGGNGRSDIRVDVLYEDLNGKVQHLTLAKLHGGSAWSPSITIPIAVNILSTANASGVTAVAFDFKVEGLQKNETLAIDDLYVDPFRSR